MRSSRIRRRSHLRWLVMEFATNFAVAAILTAAALSAAFAFIAVLTFVAYWLSDGAWWGMPAAGVVLGSTIAGFAFAISEVKS